ncbi:MAG TPA: glycerophosphodiester phosphodiesterase family protein [Acetobacteraceae bacterium]|nr:glycerophosphodiester phosphodiesterase family protein [Acetobacteraceae bacterium]
MTRSCLIIGHRGARGLFPENTLAGFAGALALGVDAVELDVGLTADRVVVVSHDPALNPNITRDAAGQWLKERGPPIRAMRAADLAAFDVGRVRPDLDYAAQFPDQSPRDGERIPTLQRVFCIHNGTNFIVELKTCPDQPDLTVGGEEMAAAVTAVADSTGVASRITVEGFDWRGPRHLHRSRPDVRLAWLTRAETVRNASVWWGGPHPGDFGGSVPRAVAAEGGPVWAPDHADLTQDLVNEAHELDLAVMPWTVNAADDMARLIGWGVDGIVTDRPDRARQILASLPRHADEGPPR